MAIGNTPRPLVYLTLGAGTLYALISLVNHYMFRTYALDLGLYTNALFDYAHLRWNDSATFKEQTENLLADHFDLYLLLWSPLSWIFRTYTLLLVQIAAVLLGGWGVFRYFEEPRQPVWMALVATAYFYLFYGFFSAFSFDYHSNVVAAALLPWFFVLVKRDQLSGAAWLLLFLVAGKENLSLWLLFVCFGLAMEYRKQPRQFHFLLGAAAFCLLWFVAVTSWVMPAFSATGAYPHFHYSALGQGAGEALVHLVTHPLEALRLLFVNHTGHPQGDFVKAELHLILLACGVWILLFKPRYLLMLIPVYAQKLYHDNHSMWGIDQQYSVEFAPVLAIGIFTVIGGLKNGTLRKTAAFAALGLGLAATVRIMDHTVLYTNKARIRFYQTDHYGRSFPVSSWHRILGEIPDDATVSAQSPLLPHLAWRDNCYLFPKIEDAEYAVFTELESPYPADTVSFRVLTSQLLADTLWQVVHNKDGLIVLKRSSTANVYLDP